MYLARLDKKGSVNALQISNFSIEELFQADTIEACEDHEAETSTYEAGLGARFENDDYRGGISHPVEDDHIAVRPTKKTKAEFVSTNANGETYKLQKKDGEKKKSGKKKATFQAEMLRKSTLEARTSSRLHL